MKRTMTKVFSLLAAMVMVVTFLPVPAALAASGTWLPYEGAGYELKYMENEDGTLTITGATKKISGKLTVPEEIDEKKVTAIGEKAFYSYNYITNVTLPDGLISIGDFAFSYCGRLTNVTLPDSVTSFGTHVFYDCGSLKSAGPIGGGYNIEFSWTQGIPDHAFAFCKSLTSVEIPDGVTSIGDNAFSNCTGLKNIEIPDGVVFIGDGAFGYCHSLTEIEIPDGITSIGDNAFSGCERLTGIKIPDSVISIGNHSFSSCWSLTDIKIPGSVTSIGPYAFYECSGLSKLEIPDGVTSIGDMAFCNCYGLTKVKIPGSVTSMGGFTFSGCNSLTSAGPIGGGYDIEFGWTQSIPDHALHGCGRLISVKLPDDVTSIGKYAFAACIRLTDIELPSSLISIGETAFCDCDSLTSVKIPDSVTSIKRYAFSDCDSLTNVKLPNGAAAIEDHTFFCCTSLTDVEIPDSITSIGEYAFEYCTSLINIELPDNVTSIGKYAFHRCDSLINIKIPSSVTSIGRNAFDSCKNLTSIEIPGGKLVIGYNTFLDCDNLADVYYGGSESQWKEIERYIGFFLPTTTVHYQCTLSGVLNIKTNHSGLVVTTMPGVTDVRLCGESGLMLGCRVIRGPAGEDGNRSWTLALPAGMECRDREVRIMTRGADGKLTDSGVRATLNITADAPRLEEVTLTDAVGAGRMVRVQAVSGLDAEKIAVYNEAGERMEMTSLGCTIVDGQKIWTGMMPAGTMGERTFTVYAVNRYGVKSGAMAGSAGVRAFA